MQNKFKIVGTVLTLFMLVGCGSKNNPTHVHNFSEEYSYNENGHYRKCTFEGCNQNTNIEEHNFDENNKCKKCGFVKTTTDVIDPIDIDYIPDISYVATQEGHYKVDSKGNRLSQTEPHTLVDYEGDSMHVPAEATCDKSGRTYQKCTVCGRINAISIDKLGHDYGQWTTIREATATEDGVKERECSRCGLKEEATLPATGEVHTHTFASTWEYNSTSHWHAATCGHDVKDSEGSHNFGNWNTTAPATATTDGSRERSCSVCGYKQTEVIPATGNTSSGDSFTITTDLNAVKEIHTSAQKTYLSYSGDYATIDPSKYPDGQSHLSDSLPVNLTWNFTPASGKTVKNYSVTFGQKSDLSDGYTVKGTTSKSIDLYNTFLGKNYFKVTAEYTDGSKANSDIKYFTVDGTAPRNLTIEGMTNCRDMGGRELISGGKIKQGMIFRTSGKNQNGSLTSNTTEVMVNQLGLKKEINVADSSSYNLTLSGTNTYNANMDYGGSAKHHFSRNAESVKNVFKLLADANNYPVFYHCRIGTDRTGLVANLVYGLLGVPLNMIYQDYLFSNFGKIGEKRYIGSQAGQDDISIYMQEINAMEGANFQEKVYNTLLSIGVSRNTLDSVINLLTEGTKPNNAKGQITLDVNDMTLSGTTATYTARSNVTDHKEPLYYAKLSSNASASYTFTTTQSGTAKIYGYLGHNDPSTSKYINNSVKVYVDSNEVTIPTLSFKDAGMGNVSNRTNYYFVPLGSVSNLAAGEHTVKITGVSDDMKLGTLSVFGVPGTVNASQGGGNGNQGGDTPHTHTIVAGDKVGSSNLRVLECECGELGDYGYELSATSSSDMIEGQVPGSDKNTRLGKGSAKADVWNITGIKAGTYKVFLNAKTQSGNENAYWNAGDDVTHNNNSSQNGGAKAGDIAYRYKISVDAGEEINVGLADTKYSTTGLGSTAAAWTNVAVAEIVIGNGAARITLKNMENGYAIWVYGVRLVRAN